MFCHFPFNFPILGLEGREYSVLSVLINTHFHAFFRFVGSVQFGLHVDVRHLVCTYIFLLLLCVREVSRMDKVS